MHRKSEETVCWAYRKEGEGGGHVHNNGCEANLFAGRQILGVRSTFKQEREKKGRRERKVEAPLPQKACREEKPKRDSLILRLALTVENN